MTTFKFQQRNDTAANWTSANPTLLAGEMGYETDSGKFKFGDGTTAWTSLTYYTAVSTFKYGFYSLSVNQTAGLAGGNPVRFDTKQSGSLPAFSSYQITLTSGKNYRFSLNLDCSLSAYFLLRNVTDNTVTNSIYARSSTASSDFPGQWITGILGANKVFQIEIYAPSSLTYIANAETSLIIEEYAGV